MTSPPKRNRKPEALSTYVAMVTTVRYHGNKLTPRPPLLNNLSFGGLSYYNCHFITIAVDGTLSRSSSFYNHTVDGMLSRHRPFISIAVHTTLSRNLPFITIAVDGTLRQYCTSITLSALFTVKKHKIKLT